MHSIRRLIPIQLARAHDKPLRHGTIWEFDRQRIPREHHRHAVTRIAMPPARPSILRLSQRVARQQLRPSGNALQVFLQTTTACQTTRSSWPCSDMPARFTTAGIRPPARPPSRRTGEAEWRSPPISSRITRTRPCVAFADRRARDRQAQLPRLPTPRSRLWRRGRRPQIVRASSSWLRASRRCLRRRGCEYR
jgi:hypothetical protein